MTPAQFKTMGSLRSLAGRRLENAQAEAARLDAQVRSAERRREDAQLVARMQREAIARIDAASRTRLIGEAVAERSLVAAASKLRDMIDRLDAAQKQAEVAAAQLQATRDAREAFQPQLQRANVDAERWKEACGEGATAIARQEAFEEEEQAQDDLMDRVGAAAGGGGRNAL